MRFAKIISGGAIILTLSGCAIAYPPVFAPPYAAPASPTAIDKILEQAATVQSTYASYYMQSAKQTDIAQLPLVGAAALAAGVLYRGNSKSQDHLAAIGIGAGGYSAYRGIILPTSLPELYLKGHSALSCIRSEGVHFSGSTALGIKTNAQNLAGSLSMDIVTARNLYRSANISSNASPAVREQFQSASSTLNDTINNSSQSLVAATKQIATFSNAETVFGYAVSNVQYNVALGARNGRSSSFADIRSAITANVASAGGAAVAPLAPLGAPAARSDTQIIADLVATSSALSFASRQLTESTPDYVSKLERVAECPKIVS